jgi:hypothetical protein
MLAAMKETVNHLLDGNNFASALHGCLEYDPKRTISDYPLGIVADCLSGISAIVIYRSSMRHNV